MKTITLAVALFAALVQAKPSPRSFTGVVTDGECADGNHSGMRMGKTAAECAKACVEYHGATLVLYDGKRSLGLDNQKLAMTFAGMKVTVVGTLDEGSGTIALETIERAK